MRTKLKVKNAKFKIVLGFLGREWSILGFNLRTSHILLFVLLVFLYFFSRIYNLVLWPIFADEAIYIRWAQVMRSEPTLRFLPLQDGKQPLFMWLVIPFLKVFKDPLFAGRFISVLSGFGTMLGVGVLSFLLTRNVEVVLLGILLYILSPFALFFDRMALVDSLLAAFGVWSLIFAFLLGKTSRLDAAMILGMVLGGALLTKSPGMFFVLMAPVAAILSLRFGPKNQKWWQALGLLMVSLIFAFGIYNILRLGPNFHMIGIRNKDYVWSVPEVLKHPLDPFVPHLRDIFRYYWSYLTPPFFVFGVLGVFRVLKDKKKRLLGLALLFWWGLPLLVQAAIAKVFTARYILFSTAPFLLFATLGLRVGFDKIKELSFNSSIYRWLVGLAFVLFLLPSLYFDWQLWQNPVKTPLPKDEYKGYLQDWTAGWGIRQIADYLKSLPKTQRIVVGTEGFFGTLPDGLQIYLEGRKNITVIGVGVPIEEIPSSLINAKKAKDRVFLVVNQSRLSIGDKSGLRLVAEYPKPGGDRLLFFEISDF